MPGIVVFRRRWSMGSDDLVVPAVFLLILHLVWVTVLAAILGVVTFDPSKKCSVDLRDHVVGYIIILTLCIFIEGLVAWVSMRGGILDTEPRVGMQYLLYTRLAVFSGEIVWLILGVKWLVDHFSDCQPDMARKAVLGIIVCNWGKLLILFICLWCAFDSAGRKWVKMKKYQDSMKEKTRRSRRSGSARRNWRQRSRVYRYFYTKMERNDSDYGRKAFRAYEESWDRRFRLMCCCVERKGRNKNSMTEIAQLFTEFFRDLDVVPSDVIAGLVLLRRYQKLRMQDTVQQGSNDVYRYLSGIAVTPRTEFLQLGQPEVLQQYKQVIHYMKFAMAAYGWPIFMMTNTGTGLCKMMPYLSCCCCLQCCRKGDEEEAAVVEDNCCNCNLAALKKISGLPDSDLIYVTYHVDIGETPFYVALDNKYRKIVICVRGTLSLQDVLTDLKADAETLPLDPIREEWVAHKGMVQAAIYIKKKLKDDFILTRAFEKSKEISNEKYDLVLVGHSLGAGTAAILAILLQQEYTDLHCYAYSPPGGLLSYNCVEETKSFITSVVVGKDVVPRIGLSQMELLRTDLINIIKKSRNPKWKIIVKALCCGSESASDIKYEELKADVERDVTAHPSDDQIGLTAHSPLFPPGRIILVVRNHPGDKGGCCGETEPVYQAIWADTSDFQEVLVSPTMVNDHMPDNVMEALEKVLVNVAPPKPTRLLSETERKALLKHDLSPGTPVSQTSPQKFPLSDNINTQIYPVNVCSSNQAPPVNPSTTSGNHGNKQWEMGITDDILLSLDRESLFPDLAKKPPRLELDLPQAWIEAPLASPEILSTASSFVGLSRTNSDCKDQTTETTLARLETIKQSPEVKVRSSSIEGEPSPASKSKHTSSNECVEVVVDTDTPLVAVCDEREQVVTVSGDSGSRLTTGEDVLHNPDRETNSYSEERLNANQGNGQTMLNHRSHTLGEISKSSNEADTLNNTYISKGQGHVEIPPLPLPLYEQSTVSEYEPEPYERHSPDECTQYGYGNPNEHYSAAGIGYPHGCGAYHPQTALPVPVASNIITGPGNKRLHYSQSESYLEALSDKYKMKRSMEQGDIAHLQDGVKVFEKQGKKRMLYPMESSPAFESKMLAQIRSNLPNVQSSPTLEEEKVSELLEENIPSPTRGSNPSDKRCSVESIQGRELHMVNSNSYTSNTASSYSEGSDKRCSSVSGQSDMGSDYPMEETDV